MTFCLQLGISLTTEPIWSIFTVKLIVPEKIYKYLEVRGVGEQVDSSNLSREIASTNDNNESISITLFKKLMLAVMSLKIRETCFGFFCILVNCNRGEQQHVRHMCQFVCLQSVRSTHIVCMSYLQVCVEYTYCLYVLPVGVCGVHILFVCPTCRCE